MERAITVRGKLFPASRDADAMIAQLHERIGGMKIDELRATFGAAAELEVRAWEIQGHAIAEALTRAGYGDGAHQQLARDWGLSRARVYDLKRAWDQRLALESSSRLEDREIVDRLPEARWYTAAAASETEGRSGLQWLRRAARSREANPRYSARDLEREIRRRRQMAAQGTVEQESEIAEAVAEHQLRRKREPISSLMWRDGRGPGGKSTYPGNHSIYVQLDLWAVFGRPQRVLDPMEGSGTTGDLCRALGIDYAGFDLRHGTNSLEDPLPGQYDFIWWHPPYWGVMDYHPGEGQMSAASSYDDFVAMLAGGFEKFWEDNLEPGGLMAVLMGDYRDPAGRYYPLCAEVALLAREHLEGVYVVSHPDYRSLRAGRGIDQERQHIPLAHEELCVFRKPRRGARRPGTATEAVAGEVVDAVPEDTAWIEELLEPG